MTNFGLYGTLPRSTRPRRSPRSRSAPAPSSRCTARRSRRSSTPTRRAPSRRHSAPRPNREIEAATSRRRAPELNPQRPALRRPEAGERVDPKKPDRVALPWVLTFRSACQRARPIPPHELHPRPKKAEHASGHDLPRSQGVAFARMARRDHRGARCASSPPGVFWGTATWTPKLALDLEGGTQIMLGAQRRRGPEPSPASSSARPWRSSASASTPAASLRPRSPHRATATSSSRSRASPTRRRSTASSRPRSSSSAPVIFAGAPTAESAAPTPTDDARPRRRHDARCRSRRTRRRRRPTPDRRERPELGHPGPARRVPRASTAPRSRPRIRTSRRPTSR